MNDENDKNENQEYRLPKRLGIGLLLASLMLNAFLLGLLTMPMMHPHHGFGPHGDFMGASMSALSPTDAAALKAAYKATDPEIYAAHQNMHTAIHNLNDELRKPEINQADLQKAFYAIGTAHAQMQASMNVLIQHVATDLSPEGRRIFADHGLPPPGPPPGMNRMDGTHHEGGDTPPPDGPPPEDRR